MSYSNPTGLPSVTQIIAPYIDSKWFTDECRERGSAVHSACEAYLKGLYAPKLISAWQLYVDSFKRWSDLAIDKIILAEVRLRNDELSYCGQPDAIIKIKGTDKIVLVDWKTSQSKQKWWELQIIAYRKLAQHNGTKTQRGLSVRLKSDGSIAISDEYSDVSAWNIFIGLLNSYKYFNGNRGVKAP